MNAETYSNIVEATIKPTKAPNNESQINWTAKITHYLRWMGSILIILSGVGFLLQGHESFLPAYRYWIGLGLILLLCSGGLICAYLLHEIKGARILLGLGAAFLPIQVAQVSAMIYSYWQGETALQPEYAWLQFMDVNPTLITLDFFITAILLLIVNYASFAFLARSHQKMLLWMSTIANILLLLPIRNSFIVPIIIAGLYVILRQTELKLQNDPRMLLSEGKAARALLSLPLWIIMARSLMHPVSFALSIVLFGIITVFSLYDIKRYTQTQWILYLFQWIGTIAAVSIWLILNHHLPAMYHSTLVTFLPIWILLFILSGQVNFHGRLYRSVASVMTTLLIFGALSNHHAMTPVLAIALGIILTTSSIRLREKIPFFCGNLCVFSGLFFYGRYVVQSYTTAPWMSLVLLGLVIIVLASLLENKEKQIIRKTQYFYNELKAWN